MSGNSAYLRWCKCAHSEYLHRMLQVGTSNYSVVCCLCNFACSPCLTGFPRVGLWFGTFACYLPTYYPDTSLFCFLKANVGCVNSESRLTLFTRQLQTQTMTIIPWDNLILCRIRAALEGRDQIPMRLLDDQMLLSQANLSGWLTGSQHRERGFWAGCG